jgi:hypothetical protein
MSGASPPSQKTTLCGNVSSFAANASLDSDDPITILDVVIVTSASQKLLFSNSESIFQKVTIKMNAKQKAPARRQATNTS